MIVLVGAQLLLSLTLLVSGLAKLPDPRSTRNAMVSLRLPSRALHAPAASALPLLELALALLPWVPDGPASCPEPGAPRSRLLGRAGRFADQPGARVTGSTGRPPERRISRA